jgi:hypothetical protein
VLKFERDGQVVIRYAITLTDDKTGGQPGPADQGAGGGEELFPEGEGEGEPHDGHDGEPSPEHDERKDHEPPPVKFEYDGEHDGEHDGDEKVDYSAGATGFAGPTSTYVPNIGRKKMARDTETNPELIRLKRELDTANRKIADQSRTTQELLIQNARSRAEKIVADLADPAGKDRILFETAEDRAEEVETIAQMFLQDRIALQRKERKATDPSALDVYLGRIRRKYKRQEYDPTVNPTDVANHAVTGVSKDALNITTPSELTDTVNALKLMRRENPDATVDDAIRFRRSGGKAGVTQTR